MKNKLKDTYYFSHDSNARNDEKILNMRAVYNYEGYGVYWSIIEMLRDSSDGKLNINCVNALSIALNYDAEKLKKFIDDCINIFELFILDGDKYYSNRLLRNIKKYKQISSKRSAIAKQMHSNKTKLNKTKLNKKKVKRIKTECLFSNSEYFEYDKFKEKFLSNDNYKDYDVKYYYEAVKNWSAGNNKMKKDWIATAHNFALTDQSPHYSRNGNVQTIKLPD